MKAYPVVKTEILTGLKDKIEYFLTNGNKEKEDTCLYISILYSVNKFKKIMGKEIEKTYRKKIKELTFENPVGSEIRKAIANARAAAASI